MNVPPVLALLDDVRWQGTPIPGARVHALLAALAVRPGEVVADERLGDEVWGSDARPASPDKALQVLVSRVRGRTGARVVERRGSGYRLTLAEDAVDTGRLRSLVTAAARADAAGSVDEAAALAREALALPLPADVDAPEPLRRLRAAAGADRDAAARLLGRLASDAGDHEEALLLLEPRAEGDEAALAALLRSEAVVRGVPAALARFERHRTRLRESLGVDPGPRLAEVHARLLAADHPVRAGLRFEATPLVGRDDDLRELRAAVRRHRVTSILGPGGLGKTRLAHLLAQEADQPVVHVVELVAVTSPDDVVAEVGSALGIRDSVSSRRTLTASQRSDVRARLAHQLAQSPTLLVLDNCEHLVDAVADLVAFLVATVPHLHVVTTTRAPLAIAAEQVFALRQLSAAESADLFCQRARAARPGVQLEPEAVRRVVDRLDGLPLAIELAAARVRAMSVSELDRRLDDRFALLRGADRSAPDRHRTLHAVIEWSWNLLGPGEQRALRRLAVFRDGFTLDGASAVVAEPDTLELVAQLVDQSLVGLDESAGGLRYRLLETVREFGRRRLDEAGELDTTQRRLRDWALALAADTAARLFGPEQVAVVHAIRAEEGNLLEELRRALRERDAHTVVTLTSALVGLWSIEGDHLKVVSVADGVVDVLHDAELPDATVPALRAVLAGLVVNVMIFTDAVADRALTRLRALGPGEEPRIAGLVSGLLAAVGPDPVGDLDQLGRHPDRHVARAALQWSSQLFENAGEIVMARERAEAALQLWEPSDGPWHRGLGLAHLASLALSVGRYAEADRHAREALPLLEALGADEDAAQVRTVFALVALGEGRVDDAERVIEEIAAGVSARSPLSGALTVSCGRAEIALLRGQVDAGLEAYRRGLADLEQRVVPGVGGVPRLSPWILFPSAAALCAHARHGRLGEAAELRVALHDRAVGALEVGQPSLDFPVLGSVLFALACSEAASWGASGPAPDRAVWAADLFACAEAFAYNRMLPTLDWDAGTVPLRAAAPGALEEARAGLAGRRGEPLVAHALLLLRPGATAAGVSPTL